jgi:hypothetical protein
LNEAKANVLNVLSIFGQQPKFVLKFGMVLIVKAPEESQKKKTRS